MKSLIIKVFTLLLASASLLSAQDKFTLSGQVRPRAIFSNRDFNSGTCFNNYVELRSRVGLSVVPIENVSVFIQIQDARVFGTETSTISNEKNIDLHQGYLLISKIFELPFNFKAGRASLAYSNERLIGAVEWTNIGRSFDGAVLSLVTDKVDIDLIGLKEIEKYNDGDSLDLDIFALYGDLKFHEKYKIQPFVIWQKMVPTEMLSRYTLGFYVKGNLEGFFHEVEFAYQLGEFIPDSVKLDIQALMAALNLGYTFDSESKPTIMAGVDYLSGDDDPVDTKSKVFNTLYGTNHKFYGYMDYFLNIPVNTYGLGLVDIHGKFTILPIKKLKAYIAYHLFNSAAEYTLANSNKSSSFGSEIDFVLSYDYNKYVNFQGGFSFFSPGEIFKEKRGMDNSAWGYLMATVSF